MTKNIKHLRRESSILKELFSSFRELALEDPMIGELSFDRFILSHDQSMGTIFVFSPKGEESFKKFALKELKKYKPGLRKVLASKLHLRKVPDLQFRFNKGFEKQERIRKLLEEVKTDLDSLDQEQTDKDKQNM